MTIKIEITGESIEEVADKLLALGSKLSGASAIAVAAATTAAPSGDAEGKAKRTRKSAPTAPEQAGSTETQTSEPAAAGSQSANGAATPAPSEEKSAPASQAPTEASIDFDKDVTPAVLGAVEAHGRDKVTEVLSQFGVARASQLDEARWPELLAALADIA